MTVDSDAVRAALDSGDPASIASLNRAECATALCEWYDVETDGSTPLNSSDRIPKQTLVRIILSIIEDDTTETTS